MGDPAQYAQYQQYYAYMQQQAQYNPQYAMQLQQYYAQYGGAGGYPPQPGHMPHQPPPPPSYGPGGGAPHGYQVRSRLIKKNNPDLSFFQGEEQTAEWLVYILYALFVVSILITGFSTENVLYSGTVQHLQKKTSLIEGGI